ncbi:MAG: DNA repair protein RecO [Planctomycetes bacterium]|nr:DNA repair protein RecO [Planctomycetota bacterium]
MPPVKDQAIVLRHLDYSETSQVLACLTREHGARRFIAKGIKRGTKKGKPSAAIDVLERGEAVFLVKPQSDTELAVLTEWRQLDAHLGLRDRLHAWYAAQYAAEITSATTLEADPHPELFDALAALLAGLASGGMVLPGAVMYQCGLLMASGWWPDLTRCVLCERSAPPGRAGFYSAVQGGLVCRRCEVQVPKRRYVTSTVLSALRSGQFDDETAGGAFEVLDDTIALAVGHPLSLSRMVIEPTPRRTR